MVGGRWWSEPNATTMLHAHGVSEVTGVNNEGASLPCSARERTTDERETNQDVTMPSKGLARPREERARSVE